MNEERVDFYRGLAEYRMGLIKQKEKEYRELAVLFDQVQAELKELNNERERLIKELERTVKWLENYIKGA